MSNRGDVVWAAGRVWTRRGYPESTAGAKDWWLNTDGGGDAWAALADLKRHGDFRWLVKNSKPAPNYDDASSKADPTRLVQLVKANTDQAKALHLVMEKCRQAENALKEERAAHAATTQWWNENHESLLQAQVDHVVKERDKLSEELADTTRSLDYTRNELDALAEVNTRNVAVGEEYRESLEALRKLYYDLQLSHAKDADEARKVHADNDQASRLSVEKRNKELWRDLEIAEAEWTKLCAQNNSQRESIESYQESVKELTAERDKAKTKLQNVRNERDILRDQRDAHKENAVELVEKLHKIGQERPWDLHKGRKLEREAIVAWLRALVRNDTVLMNLLADRIERGEHMAGDDE